MTAERTRSLIIAECLEKIVQQRYQIEELRDECMSLSTSLEERDELLERSTNIITKMKLQHPLTRDDKEFIAESVQASARSNGRTSGKW